MWPAADLIKRYQEEARVMQQIFKGPLGAQSLAMFFFTCPQINHSNLQSFLDSYCMHIGDNYVFSI